MQRMKRFARFWDLIANSGNFIDSTPMIWGDASPFWSFLKFSDAIFKHFNRTHSIPLHALAEFVFNHLIASGVDESMAAKTIWRDYQRGGRIDQPKFLRGRVEPPDRRRVMPHLPRRQARHLADQSPPELTAESHAIPSTNVP
jgi:hypothetical protein